MATETQIQANRRNAQRSTGPKTAAGKSTSKMNAVTHGIFTTNPIASIEDADAFNALSQAITSLFNPSDCIEEALVERIIMAIWRQQRARLAEAAQINLSNMQTHLANETNQALKLGFGKALTADEIFSGPSSQYQQLLQIQNELAGMDFKAISQNPNLIKVKAPLTYAKLEQISKEQGPVWERFISVAVTVESGLHEILKRNALQLEKAALKATANESATLLTKIHLVPNQPAFDLLMKYEARANSDYRQASEELRKHREWKMKTIDAEDLD